MKELTQDQSEYAVAVLISTVDHRKIGQTQLEELSGVGQPTISRVFSKAMHPTYEVLDKLLKAVGMPLQTVLDELDNDIDQKIFGYLATPLTGVVNDPNSEKELIRVVGEIKTAASNFTSPTIEIYWPGDHTHPTKNINVSPAQVYLTDRTRASAYNFIILFCADPSYGVGQENEIATQAGLPAIRLMSKGISRMMTGSFINAVDVVYKGSLKEGIQIDENKLQAAFEKIKKLYFRHRAFFKSINGNEFGKRLRNLVDARAGDHLHFAEDIGISHSYLIAMMEEEVIVSNPSLRLLKRMAKVLNVPVGHLIGESKEVDPIWVLSHASWKEWIESSKIDARIADELKNEWRHEYSSNRPEPSLTSYRKTIPAMKVTDWDFRYKNKKGRWHGETDKLF